jgi:hypothetical protein
MNHMLALALLLLVPVPQKQDLPAAFYQLPAEVREKAIIVATGTYSTGRGPCIFMPDGSRSWPLESWFQITKIYQGHVGGKFIYINPSMFPKDKYVSQKLELEREYLILLRPNDESQKVLKKGEHVSVWDAMNGEEIVAIVPLEWQ